MALPTWDKPESASGFVASAYLIHCKITFIQELLPKNLCFVVIGFSIRALNNNMTISDIGVD
jgi:hypothetical protein